MGDAKRRKKLDPKYGENATNSQDGLLHYTDMCKQLLDGQLVLVSSNVPGGIVYSPLQIQDLKTDSNEFIAYEIARQKSHLKLGIRRQGEQGKGLIELMDKDYRENTLEINDAGDSDIIFNWYVRAEIQDLYDKEIREGKGHIFLYKVFLDLIDLCNPHTQFPCSFLGVPLRKESTVTERTNLIFVCDERRVSSMEISSLIHMEKFI